jgi:hypothetical protein
MRVQIFFIRCHGTNAVNYRRDVTDDDRTGSKPVMLAPTMPTEKKVRALLEAYKAAQSMIGWNVWDGRVPVKTDKVPCAACESCTGTEKDTLDATTRRD